MPFDYADLQATWPCAGHAILVACSKPSLLQASVCFNPLLSAHALDLSGLKGPGSVQGAVMLSRSHAWATELARPSKFISDVMPASHMKQSKRWGCFIVHHGHHSCLGAQKPTGCKATSVPLSCMLVERVKWRLSVKRHCAALCVDIRHSKNASCMIGGGLQGRASEAVAPDNISMDWERCVEGTETQPGGCVSVTRLT